MPVCLEGHPDCHAESAGSGGGCDGAEDSGGSEGIRGKVWEGTPWKPGREADRNGKSKAENVWNTEEKTCETGRARV